MGIYGLESPRIPREHNKYHGYTVRGTPHCPLKIMLNSIGDHIFMSDAAQDAFFHKDSYRLKDALV